MQSIKIVYPEPKSIYFLVCLGKKTWGQKEFGTKKDLGLDRFLVHNEFWVKTQTCKQEYDLAGWL